MLQVACQLRLHWIPVCILPDKLTQKVVTHYTVLSVPVSRAAESTLVPPSREALGAACSTHHKAPSTGGGQIATKRAFSHSKLLI